MADGIVETVASEVATDLDISDDAAVASASADFTPLNSGTGTLDSLHASSATQPLAGATMHGGAGTEPLGQGWELPDDPEAFMRARAEVKASQAETAVSLRQFARGYVEPSGTVAGLSEPTDNERKE